MFIKKITDDNLWNEYLNSKLEKDFISDSEKEEIKDFVTNKKYKSIVKDIANHSYKFSIPNKHLINKNHGSKKRIVYTYSYEEMNILKFIAYLLYDYDYLFNKNLYSFRQVIGVRDAVKSITHTKNIKNMYGYKVDIKNYFNSIDKTILLDSLSKDIIDKDLYNLIKDIIDNEYVIYENEKIKEKKGVQAGNPISAFLANYYLREIDNYFWNEKVFYIRYADDIIIFTNTIKDRDKYRDELINYLNKYKLDINPKKEHFYDKGEVFEFLGFSFNGKEVDLSSNTIYKIKGKIKRSSRGIRRWMLKKDANYIVAIKAMNRKYNRKFFGNDNSELSWKYWYFPTLTTDKSLKVIDNYYQEEIRYIVTGKHNKKNYKIIPYNKLKEYNYVSLVNEYYKLKTSHK
jgi:retron-type reverse transcriptase